MNNYYNIKKEENLNKQDFIEILKDNYYFSIKVENNDYIKWIEEDLPTPNLIRYYKDSYVLMYVIKGYFGTRRGRDYLFDTIEKISNVLGGCVSDLHIFILNNFNENDKLNFDIKELSEFDHLEKSELSKRLYEENEKREILFKILGIDNIFEMGKWEIYESKVKGTLSYENSLMILEKWNERFGSKKTFSDLKCKSKNMTKWTEENYIPGKHIDGYTNNYYKNVRRKKEKRMSNKEQREKLAKMRVLETKEKIIKAIRELIKNNEKVNNVKIIKITGLSKNTLTKYKSLIQEYK